MLDENPYAAQSIAKLVGWALDKDPHLVFIIGSMLKDGGPISYEHIRGHNFPDWTYWNKNVYHTFKNFEEVLLDAPAYNVSPTKKREMEYLMFGRPPSDYRRELGERIDHMNYDIRDTFNVVKKWLL
jgi:hypothetical protein